jgi:hypothetical protein
MINYLENLSSGEKYLLLESTVDAMVDAIDDGTKIEKKNRNLTAYKSDVDAFSLERAGILHRVSKYSANQILYKIDDFAVLHLRDHSELLK